MFDQRFSSTVALCPLGTAEGVRGDVDVYEVLMGGGSCEEGIELSPVSFRQVTGPKRAPKTGDDTVDECTGSEDSMEEWEALDKDCVSDVPSADTDVDSKAEESGLGECAHTDEADEHADADADEKRSNTDGYEEEVDALPAVRVLVGTVCIWRGAYFCMTKSDTYKDMKVRMYVQWARDDEMGRTSMSRTLTPAHSGGTVESHPRAYALLRAWAIQRSRQGGWVDRRLRRGRSLAKEEDELVDHVVGIGATIGLLGCARADALFELWAPFNRDAREVAHGCDARRGWNMRSISLTSLIHYEPLKTRLARVLGSHRRHHSEYACTRSAGVVFASFACSVYSPTTRNH